MHLFLSLLHRSLWFCGVLALIVLLLYSIIISRTPSINGLWSCRICTLMHFLSQAIVFSSWGVLDMYFFFLLVPLFLLLYHYALFFPFGPFLHFNLLCGLLLIPSNFITPLVRFSLLRIHSISWVQLPHLLQHPIGQVACTSHLFRLRLVQYPIFFSHPAPVASWSSS